MGRPPAAGTGDRVAGMLHKELVLDHAAFRKDDPVGLTGEQALDDNPIAVRRPGRDRADRLQQLAEGAAEHVGVCQ